MYIDKLYTKLFSNRDWSGLKTLVSELRTFGSILSEDDLNRLEMDFKRRYPNGVPEDEPYDNDKDKIDLGVSRRPLKDKYYKKGGRSYDPNKWK